MGIWQVAALANVFKRKVFSVYPEYGACTVRDNIHREFIPIKYDKQDQQGKAAFNERNPHMTQQQEPMVRSPAGPQTKTGQGKDRA
jgi:hypothetical protein